MKRTMVAFGITALAVLPACGDDEDPGVASTGSAAVAVSDFSTLDANGDSYLDRDEVAEWVDDVGLFDEWDIDADSELDSDEIAGNAFELYDGDSSGTITETEWETATDRFYPDSAVVEPLADWDGDGDSELDADEFGERFDATFWGESWSNAPLREDTFRDAYFDLYDTDDDGTVSAEEWEDGILLLGTPAE